MVLMYRSLKPTVYLLFFILAISGGVEIVDAQVKSIKIRLSYKSKLDGNFNVKKRKLNHPLKISQKEIINHLVSPTALMPKSIELANMIANNDPRICLL